MPLSTFRIAVVADIHAHALEMDKAGKERIPSWVSEKTATAPTRQNPLTDLLELAKADKLKVDVFLCAGDLADKADDAALNYAWQALQTISSQMGAKLIVGTVGNHDLHSRSPATAAAAAAVPIIPVAVGAKTGIVTTSPIPSARVKELKPPYPVQDESEFRRYWAEHIALVEEGPCRIVTINSCASHGYIFEDSPEYIRGRFDNATERKLTDALASLKPVPINIALVHHHPLTITEANFTDESTMIRGDSLLRLLGTGNFGSWMVVHGHRHIPFFLLGPGDSDRPFIFSAGSIGIIHDTLYYPTRPPNQFYIIEFDISDDPQRTGLFGRILAWNWIHGVGWKHALDSDSIPWGAGFGNRTPVQEIAKKIFAALKKAQNGKGAEEICILTEDNLSTECPDLKYLMPSEREKLRHVLETMAVSVSRHPNDRRKLMFVYAPNITNAQADP